MMKQQYKKYVSAKFPQTSEKRHNLKQKFSSQNSNVIDSLFNILEEYHKLLRYSGKAPSTFFSSLGYKVHLSNATRKEIMAEVKEKIEY